MAAKRARSRRTPRRRAVRRGRPTAASSISWRADAKSAEQQAREKAKDDVYAFDENYPAASPVEDRRGRPRRDAGDHAATSRCSSYELSSDGRADRPPPRPEPVLGDGGAGRGVGDGRRRRQRGGGSRRTPWPESSASLSPDGSQVLFLSGSNERVRDLLQRQPVRGATAAGGTRARPHQRASATSVTDAAWSKDGQTHLLHRQHGRAQPAVRASRRAAGRRRSLTSGNHAIGGWTYVADAGRHVFTKDDPTNGGDVLTMTTGAPTPGDATSSTATPGTSACRGRKSSSGRAPTASTVEGMLFYPLDYQAGSAIRWWCRPTAGRRPPTSSASAAGATTRRCSRPRATWCCSRTTAAARATAIAFLRDMVGPLLRATRTST